ncbi:aminotransferase class I/II-fold pyridoxal phosphate-dependent enzyme [Carnimonas nigrificans]|uniref:aminotransferase class I/II-fold pyridoxal phosphate-dependent enzyme n=1 Tax=Carnimonas nigrificans TaxID=64323 RepID=UPI000472B8CD|nr:aminotransferase class I/II-fold pyridoxal phosphate-dependent enzyme [Carnimonas nigrificans]
MSNSGTDKLKKSLKQRIIEQAKQRRQSPDGERGAGLANSAEPRISEKFTRFDLQPGYQQVKMMRATGERRGIDNPFFKLHEGIAGATTVIGGRTCINFASYNYLNLSHHPEVLEAATEAMQRYGTSVSASRAVSGERPIHEAFERELAAAYDVEDAVVFVSGHATNVSTIGHLLGPRDLVLHDEYAHNSLLIGAQLSGARRMSFPHNDAGALEKLLSRHREQFERVLVVIEGLYSMDGDIPDLARFVAIKQHYHAWLMVDEAHSFGTLGSSGKGIREHCEVASRDVDIWMGTLSKTLSGCGGYIAGCHALVENLRYLAPGFLYSVGLPPQNAAASLASLRIMAREPQRIERLQHNSRYFREQAINAGFNVGKSIGVAVIPIITGSSIIAVKLSEALLRRDINVQPILYPAVPERSARLRFFINSEHSEAQIDATLSVLQQEWAQLA